MSQYDVSNIRNITFAGHGDSGKTSIVSALLFTSGDSKRHLKVDEGNTITDYDDDEIKRRISLSTGLCNASWKKHKFNILDTPGYSDFICDAFPALRSTEIAVFVTSSGEGDEFNLERLWESDSELPPSRIILVNKLDKENTSFDKSLARIQNNLSPKMIPVALPLGDQTSFSGLIDLLNNTALEYDASGSGKSKSTKIPANMADQVEDARTVLIEAIAEIDDELLEKYLEGEEISSDELRKALKIAVLEGHIYPVIPVSALKNIGSSFLLDFCVDFAPSPADTPAKKVDDTEILCDESGKAVAQVFKTIIDPYSGKISIFRVYSGSIKTDVTYKNSSRNENEKISALFFLQGKTQVPTTSVNAGDIGAVSKLKSVKSGDTICSSELSLQLDPINYPQPLITFSFTPLSKSDEEKISTSLSRLAEEDPTLQFKRDAETNQLLVSGMGQLHLDVTHDRLKRKYGVNAKTSPPKIPYRETVKGNADVRYRHKKQSGGAGQFGEVAIRLMPLPKGTEEVIGGLNFVNKIVGGVIPGQYIPSVEKGIRSTMTSGIVAGYPVTDIQVELYDGKSHPVDSKDIAFQIAGTMALKKAFQDAKPILLEPIVTMKIEVTEVNMGDVIGDLNSKRGKVVGMESKGKKQVIVAQVPMAEVLIYEPELRSMTGGRGSFSMELDHYEEVPSSHAEGIIADYKAQREE